MAYCEVILKIMTKIEQWGTENFKQENQIKVIIYYGCSYLRICGNKDWKITFKTLAVVVLRSMHILMYVIFSFFFFTLAGLVLLPLFSDCQRFSSLAVVFYSTLQLS
jgi:hypothetical protein